jgi:membrane-bound metal-dependent hydrolase YbcI (DUF457 family)
MPMVFQVLWYILNPVHLVHSQSPDPFVAAWLWLLQVALYALIYWFFTDYRRSRNAAKLIFTPPNPERK